MRVSTGVVQRRNVATMVNPIRNIKVRGDGS